MPSYGNKSNQNDNLTEEWKTLQEGHIHQYEALFKELDKWNECLEKSPVSGLMPPYPDKEP